MPGAKALKFPYFIGVLSAPVVTARLCYDDGMTLDQALETLRAAKPLLDRYGVARIGVFGSVARGEAGPDSDVDVLVEFKPDQRPGWEFFGLAEDLSAVLKRPVDVVTPKSLKRLMRDRVLGEVVYA